ncbi:dihydropteroate synthase [Comamonas badia]|uniref:dihydropteroate synthase n=1 Tax=Comamonas badia TaxID=265291 RepID=UPI0004141F87|nr:dihydropteroate synthase [Comamonas badia]
MYWQTTRFAIDLSRPRVMGIVNVTPDSFSDGGDHASPEAAIAHCERLVHEGADILDIGGESTRPGSPPLPLHDELDRLLPVVRAALTLGVPVSVDTYKPQVMQQVLDLGVDIINDIWALRQPGAQAAVAGHLSCGVCLMHMHRDPRTMQTQPMQGDVLAQVMEFLEDAADRLRASGVAAQRIVIDPGIGFGKTVEQNFVLLARQQALLGLGYPVLAGWSHKSSLGAVTGLPVRERVAVSAVAAVLAVQRGASIVRVHEVGATVAALAIWQAVQAGQDQPTEETGQ